MVGAAKREWPGPEFLVGGGEEMEGGSGSHFDVEILPSSHGSMPSLGRTEFTS